MTTETSTESKVVVSLQGLVKALKQTKGTIATQDVQVLLRNYLITGDKEKGILTLLATDLDLASVGVCPATISENFSIAVPGIKLVQIANSASCDAVTLIIKGQQMNISAGKFKCELQGLPSEDFPNFPDFDTLSASSVPRELFLTYLKRISFSINDNVVKKNLLAVHIAQGYIQASDGKVTAICKCSLSGKLNEITIPAMAVTDLIAALAVAEEADVEISELDAFLVFKVGESRFLARKSTAKFPDVLKIVVKPTDNINEIVSFDRDDFKSAVQRVSVVADEKSLAISLEITKDQLKIFTHDAAGNKAEESVDASWNGEEGAKLKFNYTYLLDIMTSVIADSVRMKVPKSLRLPVRFDDTDFSAFLMRLVG